MSLTDKKAIKAAEAANRAMLDMGKAMAEIGKALKEFTESPQAVEFAIVVQKLKLADTPRWRFYKRAALERDLSLLELRLFDVKYVVKRDGKK